MSRRRSIPAYVTITYVGYIRPRRRFGRWRSASVVLGMEGDTERAVARRWCRYLIAAEFTIGALVRHNVVGTAWTRRGAERVVRALRGGAPHRRSP